MANVTSDGNSLIKKFLLGFATVLPLFSAPAFSDSLPERIDTFTELFNYEV
ncbi:histidine kinase, partial [Vibrio sp. V42_P2S4T144]|nr:histidine kinase [Vibrio sp. V42_P2S4T144]